MGSTESPATAPGTATPANPGQQSLPRIIVVDDSKVVRNAAQKMLAREFDVLTAEDGEEAWHLLEGDASIRVVFTDLTMPNLNGYELLRRIRAAATPELQSVPVIVVTGAEDSEAARVRVLELGATDFVTKPFTTIDLLARARAHATYQRITQQLRSQTTLDALTGLVNKTGFLDRLQQDIAYARRHHPVLTLVRLEIDDFRTIFLKHGKDAGERGLMHLAQMIRTHIRKEDTAGRISLGGFALSLPAGELDGVERMVERLRAEAAAHEPDSGGFRIALSAAILRIDLDAGQSAQDALDACQAKLESARAGSTTPTAAAAAPPMRIPASSPPPMAAQTPGDAAAAHAPRQLRLDPILDQLDRGHAQPAMAGMPLILNRLLPLLRLLSANQRAQLIRLLQQVSGQHP
jgi:two-component system cell cycle response regulator